MPAIAQTAPKRKILKGIMWGTVGVPGSVMQKMEAVKAAGFDGVEPMGGMDNAEMNAALKATGVAANPLMLLDLAGGLALDTALAIGRAHV